MARTVSFSGIVSGDYECFCWAVTREVFIQITGEEPDEHDKSPFVDGAYMIHPGTVIGLPETHRDKELEFTVSWKAPRSQREEEKK